MGMNRIENELEKYAARLVRKAWRDLTHVANQLYEEADGEMDDGDAEHLIDAFESACSKQIRKMRQEFRFDDVDDVDD